jgi:ech hydrogenase subunit D
METQNIKRIEPFELLAETIRYKTAGYRLIAISCTYHEGFEITYSFGKEMEFENLRIQITDDVEIASISTIYPYSFLYENEIKELFGAKINDISLDYEDNLYRIAKKTPFNDKKGEE